MKTEERILDDMSEIITSMFELKDDLKEMGVESEDCFTRIDKALDEMLELYEKMIPRLRS